MITIHRAFSYKYAPRPQKAVYISFSDDFFPDAIDLAVVLETMKPGNIDTPTASPQVVIFPAISPG
jgi:hypothetical protein